MLVSIALNSPFLRASLCAFGIGLSAISQQLVAQDSNSQTEALPEGIAATVNGRPIPFSMISQIEQDLADSEGRTSREDILNELINLELLTQRAEAQTLDKKPSVIATLRLQYAQTMANAYLEVLGDELTVTDEQVRAEYDKQIQLLEVSEYRASHILLENEADAIEVVNTLDAGADFAKLAKERSTGPTASQGGDLGWFDDATMVAEFTEAVTALEKGEYTEAPVQTQFGWHVIKLDATRAGIAPDFDSVKSGIRNLMVRNMLSERVNALREQADIQRIQ